MRRSDVHHVTSVGVRRQAGGDGEAERDGAEYRVGASRSGRAHQ